MEHAALEPSHPAGVQPQRGLQGLTQALECLLWVLLLALAGFLPQRKMGLGISGFLGHPAWACCHRRLLYLSVSPDNADCCIGTVDGLISI
jgi:hypothetical protein